MDTTLEARFLGNYYCSHVVYVVHVASMMCAHVVSCIYSVCTCFLCNVMYKMIHIVLCEYCIWGCAHVGYVVLCTDGAMYMLDM